MVIGSTTKQMGREYLFIKMEQNIKVKGKMINKMGWEPKLGLMALNTQESINKAKSTEKDA